MFNKFDYNHNYYLHFQRLRKRFYFADKNYSFLLNHTLGFNSDFKRFSRVSKFRMTFETYKYFLDSEDFITDFKEC